MFEAAACTETISILRAIVFGVDGACIDIGLTSILGGIAMFVGCVLVLRFIGATVLRRILPSRRQPSPSDGDRHEPLPEDGLRRQPYESPIRSTGAWGSRGR